MVEFWGEGAFEVHSIMPWERERLRGLVVDDLWSRNGLVRDTMLQYLHFTTSLSGGALGQSSGTLWGQGDFGQMGKPAIPVRWLRT